ncbi:MAG: amidohydrolase family protein [Bryobacteraceae bacterium]
MPTTWEVRDYDLEFFEKDLNSFVPDRLFDAHAHLYRMAHWGRPTSLDHGPDPVTLEVFRSQMEWITPRRHTSGLFFGVGFNEGFSASNDFIDGEVTKDNTCFGHFLVPPTMDPELLRQEVRSRKGMVGLKVYHSFITGKASWLADIGEFLTEPHVRVAHEEGWSITLHMVRDRAMADRANQERIVEFCTRYPNMKLILAHAARGFNPHHTIEGIGALKGLRNVWCDSSAVTEAGAFEAIVETLGHDRLLWGSDYPVSHLRGRCVAIGDQFVWLYEDTLDWDTVAGHTRIRPLLIGLESLRAMKLAAMRLRLSDSQIEDIFHNNAVRMLQR